MGLGFIFIFGPSFLFFLVNEFRKGALFPSEALIAFAITIAGDFAFATISWLVIEPMRKKRYLSTTPRL